MPTRRSISRNCRCCRSRSRSAWSRGSSFGFKSFLLRSRGVAPGGNLNGVEADTELAWPVGVGDDDRGVMSRELVAARQVLPRAIGKHQARDGSIAGHTELMQARSVESFPLTCPAVTEPVTRSLRWGRWTRGESKEDRVAARPRSGGEVDMTYGCAEPKAGIGDAK